ncbi:nucleotide exchange factor GrpE [Hoylesella nanceiensis]|uniref:nucleotide exchange factor GrpE n=1 Tax=Hoylesella nanceiensis TaxID=425941 RepID=UPI001CAF32A3|nr:nucleotide exchange factor GrpE [Hoylesella nanceiensis]MBF1420573.1 nucleotide exchange factor GrpE [Hoylesella nanceiensis]MBF1454285.1 nucleotide exchange factor GrpE [Hoylesella nanceiensis]
MSNKGQNTEKDTLNKESLNAEETTNTADSQNECNETTSQGEPVETVETLKAELETLKDKYLRTVAEFDNYKKRTLKEKTELILNGSEKTVTTFLPILDDMERAIANAGKAKDITAVEEGWELIYNKFIKQLDSIGVKKIETNDADFDVDYHEAVAMVPGMGDDKKGKVIDCVQTGYTLNDKVIRHAKVAVGQ